MKHLFYSCIILLGLLVSCSEESIVPKDDRVRQALSLPHLADRKLAYGLLKDDEKSAYWKMHITTVSQEMDLTEEQKEAIQQTLQFISAENIRKGESDELKNWKIAIEKKFDMPTRIKLFGNVDNAPVQNVKTPAQYCECRMQEDFCGRDNTGWPYPKRYFCYPTYPVCMPTATGCGYFWLSLCNGKCAQEPEE